MLELNNRTWKKYKTNFLLKNNEAQTVVLQSGKNIQLLEKNFFEKKKILPAYFCRYDLQNHTGKRSFN